MKKNILPTVVLGSILVVVALLLSVVNMITGPIIEAQRNAAANGALLEVLPEGEGFAELNVTELALPAGVTNAYRETTGKGYVFRVTATGYKPGLVVMVGIDAEGKVTGSKCLESQDTFGKEPQIDNAYNGQSLADFTPVMLGGATMTSNGYRDAVSLALQAFVLASGGELDPSIELEKMIPTVAPGFINPAAVTASGNIKKALKAANGAGFAYIMTEGEESYLAVVNAMGACKIYDVEGADVTAAHATLVTEAQEHAGANQTNYLTQLTNKVGRLMTGATEVTALTLDTFNTVVSAVSFKVEDATYYGFYSRSVGFHQMEVFLIIDANGAIAKLDATQFIFEEQYFATFGGMNVTEYKNGFVGITGESWTGEQAVIATATMTSNAVKQSTTDAFAAFNSINGGEQ
ncbi:MAG: FMN-binding protein [Clostridia bacterium]|nr:FMN-binding protein [Clostridia bacterium]